MNTKLILLAVAAVAIAGAMVFAFMSGENNGEMTIDTVIDEDGRLDEFSFIHDNGKTEPITQGMRISTDVDICYSGSVTEWLDDVEITNDPNLVIFKANVNGQRIDYVFKLDNIKTSSMKGYLKDGVPMLEVTAKDGFSINLMYFDHKGMEDIQKYDFQTYEFIVGENVTLPVYYGDKLFATPATQKNMDLMAFALGLELSTGVSGSDRSSSVIKLLQDIGCPNARPNDVYSKAPSPESTDVAIGSKQWNGYNLIFVALNGTKYTSEFAANVMLGESGNHYGFTLACNEALKALREFISDNGITGKTKILITGYSRTAAGANLAAAYMSDAIAEGKVKERIGNIELTKEDVYGFSFETPLCGYYESGKGLVPPTDGRYSNIWYVINPDDPVTYVPTKNYGFVRYGNQFTIQSHDSGKQSTMLDLADKYYGTSKKYGNLTPRQWLDLSGFNVISDVNYPSDIYDGFLDKFFSSLGTREYYYKNVEKDFSRFVFIMFDKMNLPKAIVDESGGAMKFISDLYLNSGSKEMFEEHFRPIISKAAAANGCPDYTDSILNAMYQISELVKRYFSDGFAILTDKYVLSMVANYNYVLISHLPSMTYCYIIQESPLYV